MQKIENTFASELLKISSGTHAGHGSLPVKNNVLTYTKDIAGFGEGYISVVEHPQGISDLLHSNDFFELLYVPSGRITLSINGGDLTLKEREVLFLTRTRQRHFRRDTRRPTRFRTLHKRKRI